MIHRLFTLASALSLLLGLAVGTLWAAARDRPLAFEFVGPGGSLWEAAVRNDRVYLDTSPQLRLDESPRANASKHWTKLARRWQPYSDMYKARSEDRISRQEWERFQTA
ncbi:MAG TPA: hypothetical protein VGI81_27560 [Tepidisphaeraceae bacterium]|jgi:hypothetical protein